MSKYILTLLLCLSSHTLAATDHTQTARSLTTENNSSSSKALHKKPSTTQKKCRPSFLQYFWGYCGFTLIGAASCFFIILPNYKKKLAIIIPFFVLLINGKFLLAATNFYTKSNKACKPSLFKHGLSFFAFEVVGSLAMLSFLFLDQRLQSFLVLIPTVIALLLCAIGALMYVFYFNHSHEEDRSKTEASQHSFWETFFGFFTLTLPGAWTLLCSFSWIDFLDNGIEFSDVLNPDKWDSVAIMISLSGLLMSLGIAFIAAYFYTKSHKAYKHSLKKHTIGFFALCVEGYLATLLFCFIDYLKNNTESLLTFVIPIITSLSICAISAKRYVDSFNKRHQKAEGKQATKSVP